MREIVFYRTESGDCPVEEFLDSLSAKQAQKVTWVMELIEDLEVVPVKYFKKMIGTNDIWEIRVQSGSNIFRILGFVEKNNLVVLNHAFQKKTQKTPRVPEPCGTGTQRAQTEMFVTQRHENTSSSFLLVVATPISRLSQFLAGPAHPNIHSRTKTRC